ncbi:hypothetical protein [Paenarthrobacter nicotinovorans]|uniref:hypothetical protein n=1 Tax=Paenarthrobacter nicotinovorans TaxID=29320 RepID=UPI0016661455|nr:hypothetical protein [Paenarthrobacter nicotinovorans]MBP2395380.1 hypothetical protein [Paenarthrobacter nicotinovorans]UKE98486.1 hypothetical protein LU808_16115 [Paenarthrobacter nicotinovorans]UKF03274.1 hypothetical protein JMY29_16155 [Paenarthrobacter nicotinovorans]
MAAPEATKAATTMNSTTPAAVIEARVGGSSVGNRSMAAAPAAEQMPPMIT